MSEPVSPADASPASSPTDEAHLRPASSASSKGKGHRRVKSLVRELEDQQQEPAKSPPSSPEHSRRLSLRASQQSLRPASGPTTPGGAAPSSPASNTHKYSPSATFNRSMSTPSPQRGAVAPPVIAEQGLVTPHQVDERAAEAAEEGDVFLPLSSSTSSSPYTFDFANTSPTAATTLLTPGSSNGSATSLSAFDKREHSRRHSRIHSRNLSVFFPKPGSEAAQELSAYQGPSPHLSPVSIPGANVKVWAAESAGGDAQVYRQQQLNRSQNGGGGSPAAPNARRGHHHRHSMSHNFYDQSPTSPATPLSASVPKVASRLSLSQPSSLPSGSVASSLRNKYGHLPSFVRFFLALAFHIPLRAQLALSLASAELCLGAALWIYGQSGESLAVTGLGYLVVFDAIGALSHILIEDSQDVEVLYDLMSSASKDDLRHPFGTHRLTTLSHFAQAIYLLFSGIYVCKESIEHVLLLHEPVDASSGADGHGSAHGSMGHGEGRGYAAPSSEWVEIWISMPTGLLFLSVLMCLGTAFFLKNHVRMTEAVGPSTYALRPKNPRQSLSLFSNPFSLLVLSFSTILALASFTISAVQLAPLDKVLALLESIAMFYVAYPAAEATGKVLLQVAPPKDAPAMRLLYKAIKELEGHPSVLYIPRPHVWQLTPHPREQQSNMSSAKQRVPTYSDSHAIVVANLKIHLKPDVPDQEILIVTTFARERCAGAFKGGPDGDTSTGELNVVCVKGLQEDFLHDDHSGHHHHHHPQGHSHGHDHGHSHSHGHDHGHGHHDHHAHSNADSCAHHHHHDHEEEDHSHSHAHAPSHTHVHMH